MKSNVLGGHFMKDDVTLFDASFFNFSAEVAAVSDAPLRDEYFVANENAQSLDPQFRLQLESTYEALESGATPSPVFFLYSC